MTVKIILQRQEQLEELRENLFIVQHKEGYRFSLDAVLVAGFVQPKPGEKIFDLGTGSGVIPLLLWAREPELWLTGLEIQARLAKQAQKSVTINGLDERITIIQGDLKELKQEWLGRWDTVVTNPPFFAGHSGRINPSEEKALARHELACTLEDIVLAAHKLLKKQGRFILIHKPERLSELLKLFSLYRFSLTRLTFVHGTEKLPAKFMLVEAVLDSGKPLEVLPPVIIHEQQGAYSPQLERLLAGGNLF